MPTEDARIEKLHRLFHLWAGLSANEIEALPASGSQRRYYRLIANNTSAIGVWNPDVEENQRFIALARHFQKRQLPVPDIFMESPEKQFFLQTDLGELRLFDLLPPTAEKRSLPIETEKLYRKSIELLLRLQFEGGENLDYQKICKPPVFDQQAILADLHYFKYYFLKIFELPFDESALEKDFFKLADKLSQKIPDSFQHRDYQSRNLMLKDEQIYVIDFQGGRRGEMTYDLAALLWQARAQIPPKQREQLFLHYAEGLKNYLKISLEELRDRYIGMVLLRSLQVLGAYGLRGKIEGKPHFYQSILPALDNLKLLLDIWPHWQKTPQLYHCLQQAQSEIPHKLYPSQIGTEYANMGNQKRAENSLLVHISSFSYKKGLPEDASQKHGGGFVFDCRFLDNPGRLEKYKKLSGLDAEVQNFLLQREETHRFIQRVFSLVDEAVEKYIYREFDSLQVHFGCTGGQHRSVFMAEQLAGHLQEQGVKTVLTHRERSSWPIP